MRVDLKLLKKQKLKLYILIEMGKLAPEDKEAMDGILNLLDYISDSLEDKGVCALRLPQPIPSTDEIKRKIEELDPKMVSILSKTKEAGK